VLRGAFVVVVPEVVVLGAFAAGGRAVDVGAAKCCGRWSSRRQ
jgi:hypothetical protein